MTLASVPPRMGGAAGGPCRPASGSGTAVGAAVLTAAYRLTETAHGVPAAVSAAFTVALLFTAVALVMAVRELRIRPDLGEAAEPPKPRGPRRARLGRLQPAAASAAPERGIFETRPDRILTARLPAWSGEPAPPVAEIWQQVTTVAPAPSSGLLLGTAAVSLALVMVPEAWRRTRHLVTIAHEGAHGLAAR